MVLFLFDILLGFCFRFVVNFIDLFICFCCYDCIHAFHGLAEEKKNYWLIEGILSRDWID